MTKTKNEAMKKQTMEQIINEALSQFEIVKRGDNDIVVLKREAPEALRDSVHKAHGDRLPKDWIYDKYHSIIDAFAGYAIEDTDGLDENRPEIVNGLVDVYTGDLTAWLNSSIYNVYYMTEAQEEYGPETDGFKLLMSAQYKAIDDIAGEVISYLTAQVKE